MPIQSLLPVNRSKQKFQVQMSHQSEEEKLVNGQDTEIEIHSSWKRHPFVIMIDGIVSSGLYLRSLSSGIA